jgi:hypothetical protein
LLYGVVNIVEPVPSTTIKGDTGGFPNCHIREHQIRTVKPDEIPELLDQRSLHGMKTPKEVIHSQFVQRSNHRQSPNQIPDQAERYQIPRRHLPQLSISTYLVIFRQLTETQTAPAEPRGDDVLQTDERRAADEQDVRRVEGSDLAPRSSGKENHLKM